MMLPFANPLFPDLSGASSVIPAGNPEGSLGCLHGNSSHGVMQDLGGVKGKELFAPNFPGGTRQNSRPEKMCFSLLSKTVSLF